MNRKIFIVYRNCDSLLGTKPFDTKQWKIAIISTVTPAIILHSVFFREDYFLFVFLKNKFPVQSHSSFSVCVIMTVFSFSLCCFLFLFFLSISR